VKIASGGWRRSLQTPSLISLRITRHTHFNIDSSLVFGTSVKKVVEGFFQGRRHGGLGGTVLPHKGHFCKSSKTDEKKMGVWEAGDVTNRFLIST